VRFSLKRQDGLCAKFSSGFTRKHLFITICIEKHCTRPLKSNQFIGVCLCGLHISDIKTNMETTFV